MKLHSHSIDLISQQTGTILHCQNSNAPVSTHTCIWKLIYADCGGYEMVHGTQKVHYELWWPILVVPSQNLPVHTHTKPEQHS